MKNFLYPFILAPFFVNALYAQPMDKNTLGAPMPDFMKKAICESSPNTDICQGTSKSVAQPQPNAPAVAAKIFAMQDLGYLNGKIKTFDGGGCSYIRSEEDRKKPKPKLIGADDYTGKGLVINLNGNDVLFKEVLRSEKLVMAKYGNVTLTIPDGKAKSCGIECSKTFTNFEFQQGTTSKIIIPVVSFCGS